MKKIIASLLCTILIVNSLCLSSEAIEVKPGKTDEAILSDMGIPENIIEVIPEKDKEELISAYLSDSKSIEVSTSTLEIDVLSEMREFVTKSDTELQAIGYSEEKIDGWKNIINMYLSTSDEELKANGLTDDEITALRNALHGENSIQPLDDISPSKLTFTQVSTNYTTNNYPNYFIRIYFTWNSPFFCQSYDDKIVIAWGGGLTQAKSSQTITYCNHTLIPPKFGDVYTALSANYKEIAVDAMGIYSFDQCIPGTYAIAKSGSIVYQIYQSGAEGKVSKAIAYYAHQTTQFTGSISFTGTGAYPAVSIGTGYDTIYAESNITY